MKSLLQKQHLKSTTDCRIMKKDVLLGPNFFFSFSLLHAARISPCRFIDPLHSIQFLALARVLLLQTRLTRPIDFAGLKTLFSLLFSFDLHVSIRSQRSICPLVRM
jgi:hypothetical protein